MDDPIEQFILLEIAIAYTTLWGACLHRDEEHRDLSRLQAKAAYDTAMSSSSRRRGEKGDELVTELCLLRQAIDTWSVENVGVYRNESSRLAWLTVRDK